MRAIIRVTLPDTTDEEAIELKQQIEALVAEAEGALVEVTITSR